MLYIIVGILMFSVMIALHEFGHFFTAKLLGVQVNEFSIGMGPALLKKRKGETLYSLRALPIGGYCAMEGEDEESDSYNPRALGNVAAWRQIIIMCAGSFMNLLLGFVLVIGLFSQHQAFNHPTISGFTEGFGLEDCGLQAGDVVHSIDGHRVYVYNNLSTLLGRAGENVDWVVLRDGEKVELNDLHMPVHEVKLEDGRTGYQRGLQIGVYSEPATLISTLHNSWLCVLDFVRMVWMSLGDLITGAVGVSQMTGPVGIVNMITQVGSHAPSTFDAFYNIIYFAALITVNLGVMNMLPIPALDGGRVFFLLVNSALYAVCRKKIAPKYEAYVHMAGMGLLLSLMLFVTYSDIRRILGM